MTAVTNVPWKTILLHGPTLVEAARTLYAATRKAAAGAAPSEQAASGIEPLRRAVEALAEREVQQAALLADLARQVQDMATALDVLRARIVLTLVGAALAVALSLLSVGLLLWR